jgi:hypothetical protein
MYRQGKSGSHLLLPIEKSSTFPKFNTKSKEYCKESGNLKHWNIVVPKILLQHVIPALHFMPSPSIYFQILDPYLHCQDRNIILALAHEYRAPSAEVIRKAVEDSGNPSASVPWNSRYVGLVVVPGQHITKVEFEESTLPGQKNSVTL